MEGENGTYPYSIYGDGILKFLTYVIPLALFQYYPLLYLLGKKRTFLYVNTITWAIVSHSMLLDLSVWIEPV